MKRLISIFLILTLALGLLCSCGGNENNVSSDVSQIEAVVNVSSEEITSQAEVVESAESSVPSETEVSSEVVSSEVSTPSSQIKGDPVEFQVGYSKMDCSLEWEEYNKTIINSASDLEKLTIKYGKTEYNEILERYNDDFLKTKSIIFIVSVGSNTSFRLCECKDIAKKDNTLTIDVSKYYMVDGGFADVLVYSIMIIEVDKLVTNGINDIVINTTEEEYKV